MIIAIPSKGRALSCYSNKILKDAILFVPDDEYSEYVANNENEIVSIPNHVKGITATRNWILKAYHGQDVLFVDDDVRETGYFDNGKRIDLKKESNSDSFNYEFKKIFQVCKDLDFKIWGIECGGSKSSNHPLRPYSFKATINGSLMGIVNDGEFYFDEKFKVKEDYEIALRHYKTKGGILKVKYFYWRTYHWDNEGGCVDYRTDEMEETAIAMLKERYPFMIKTNKRKNKYSILIEWD